MIFSVLGSTAGRGNTNSVDIEYLTLATAPELDPRRAVVVVDVMRAFTTAAWALHRGATQIVMFAELADALSYKATTPRALAFCDGEPKVGFDLFNSPAHLLNLDVAGRPIAQCTTAGTQGAVAAGHADLILCTGFVTASATARLLAASNPAGVSFVVTGGEEDRACAEHIACLLRNEEPGASFIDRARHSAAAEDLLDGVRRGYRGVDAADVDMCLDLDRFEFAMPAARIGNHLVLKSTPGVT